MSPGSQRTWGTLGILAAHWRESVPWVPLATRRVPRGPTWLVADAMMRGPCRRETVQRE